MHNSVITVITIRDIPPDASEHLNEQAAARGQSLQQFLRRELIEISQRSTLETELAAVLDSLPALRISDTEIEALLNDARAGTTTLHSIG